ncbi:hypothetical protein DICPUDRAFT_154376 [Dictyostelium purpureum]|uniref:Uncharacterized protein n=1 Tax=Dictyostelium purpureum TaxID=5786 RepID=F0ZR71_DICPU|nr:uncharacterized protein DICPUDRAFT_154376 [Dictyostelium purpureum]EGC33561.1 hypothetical protein DICPUDRAFT_154376 [Dictyostelium purpureum]|eukprot:XP_003289910.1 hypothetical protein DICPUDRAFT_154376 [Dictyostelium purpureum]
MSQIKKNFNWVKKPAYKEHLKNIMKNKIGIKNDLIYLTEQMNSNNEKIFFTKASIQNMVYRIEKEEKEKEEKEEKEEKQEIEKRYKRFRYIFWVSVPSKIIIIFIFLQLSFSSFSSNYKNYSLYNIEIVNLCCVSKQWFDMVSKNISHTLYCSSELDDWIDTIYKNVKTRLYNIINNDIMGELMFNTITFDSYFGYKNYKNKIENNIKNFNNNNNNNSLNNKTIIIQYRGEYGLKFDKKCLNEIIKIIETSEEIPSNVEFNLEFFHNIQFSGNIDKYQQLLKAFDQLCNIATIKHIEYNRIYLQNFIFDSIPFFKPNSLESIEFGNFPFQIEWFSKINLPPNLKKLSIYLPLHDISRAISMLEEEYEGRQHKCGTHEITVQDPNNALKNWETMIQKLQDSSSIIDLTLNTHCIRDCFPEKVDFKFVSNGLKSILSSPKTFIKYLKLRDVFCFDDVFFETIKKSKSIVSLEISSKLRDIPYTRILDYVSYNKNIIHLKLGGRMVTNIFTTLLNYDQLYLNTLTLDFTLFQICKQSDLELLIKSRKCKLKELHIKSGYKLFDFNPNSTFKLTNYNKINNKVITLNKQKIFYN